MASRLWKQGSLVTRVRNLLKAGVLKERPLWLDVVEAFPPIVSPQFNRRPEKGTPPLIEYPEDRLIERFYEIYGASETANLLEREDLSSSLCTQFVSRQLELMEGGLVEDQAFRATADEFQKRGIKLKKERERRVIEERKDSESPLQNILTYFKDQDNK